MGLRTRVKQRVIEFEHAFCYRFPITRPRRIVFDHLPKCGGSTVSDFLTRHYPDHHVFTTGPSKTTQKELTQRFQGLPESERHRYRLILGHDMHKLFGFAHPDCLKITMLREPIERIVSHYYYAKETPRHDLYASIHSRGMSLEDYAASDLSEDLRNWYTAHFSGLPVEEAERQPGAAVDRALGTLQQVYDLVGFVDDFATFMNRLCRLGNLRFPYEGTRVNVTKSRPPLDGVPPSALQKIEAVNHLDCELYRRVREAIG